jgi:precorrin-4 methylase
MIRDKIIKLGTGDISVGFTLNTLIFTEIEPIQRIETTLHNDSDIKMGSRIVIQATTEEFQKFKDKLNNINKDTEDKQIEFEGYTFDFSEFNKESIKNLILCVDIAMYGLQVGIAV